MGWTLHAFIAIAAVFAALLGMRSTLSAGSSAFPAVEQWPAISANNSGGMYKAIITGGTGAIGKYVVADLLSSPKWSQVTVVGRRRWVAPEGRTIDVAAEEAKGRLVQVAIDMEDLPAGKHAVLFNNMDAAFCALGTTHADAESAAAFRRVDLDYVKATAEMARAASTPYFGVVTASGTGSWWNSFSNYGRTKAAAEEAVKGLNFPVTAVFRPGLLDRGDAMRPVEKMACKVLSSIRVETVARAMVKDAEASLDAMRSAPVQSASSAQQGSQQSGSAATAVKIYENADIFRAAAE